MEFVGKTVNPCVLKALVSLRKVKQMAKFGIAKEERYPDYSLMESRDSGPHIELSGEEAAEYEQVCAEYDQWQERFKKAEREYYLASAEGVGQFEKGEGK